MIARPAQRGRGVSSVSSKPSHGRLAAEGEGTCEEEGEEEDEDEDEEDDKVKGPSRMWESTTSPTEVPEATAPGLCAKTLVKNQRRRKSEFVTAFIECVDGKP